MRRTKVTGKTVETHFESQRALVEQLSPTSSSSTLGARPDNPAPPPPLSLSASPFNNPFPLPASSSNATTVSAAPPVGASAIFSVFSPRAVVLLSRQLYCRCPVVRSWLLRKRRDKRNHKKKKYNQQQRRCSDIFRRRIQTPTFRCDNRCHVRGRPRVIAIVYCTL